jgi:bifunctional non-homologous end joining protein LigD
MATKPQPEVVTAGGREVLISNPGKILFPEAGYTKLDLVRYYLAVADGALRGAGGRPNVLVRYPNGLGQEFFHRSGLRSRGPTGLKPARVQPSRAKRTVTPRDSPRRSRRAPKAN